MSHEISKHPFWTRDEFMAFILFYAANADMECTHEEKQMILNSIPEGHLPAIETEYNRLSDYERISVIQAYKGKYYQSAAQKKEILDTLKKICNADGEYSIMEKNMVMMLQRIL